MIHNTSFEDDVEERRNLRMQSRTESLRSESRRSRVSDEETKMDKASITIPNNNELPPAQSNKATAGFILKPRPQTLVANDGNSDATNSIPRRLLFTYSKNLLHEKTPKHLHDNVQHSIQVYADAWGIEDQSHVEVLFYTDKECIELLKQVEPKYLPIFQTETFPAYRGDICRTAALYLYGGYYLDVDIETLQALEPPSNADFITAKMQSGTFFQAIIATTPFHPVLKAALESMLNDWYMIPSVLQEFNKSETEFDSDFFRGPTGVYNARRMEHLQKVLEDVPPDKVLMGPGTLRIAFDRQKNKTTPWFLEEMENSKMKLYPELIRDEGSMIYRGCNYIVHDPGNTTAYFYSRCRGTGYCP
ncbi:unnamed protein product [Cylindrotheca closterium]|uniref:Uncharacterized protein n=1 Tax=Cylindrotheca closterium TaxID=2856 RepID=A0AAD2CMM5_9STRA|nr:unnamed protein product [Cylindrotheca closterium]